MSSAVKDGPVTRYPDLRIDAGVRVFPCVDRSTHSDGRRIDRPAVNADSSLTVAAPCGIRTHFPCRRASSVVWPEYSMSKSIGYRCRVDGTTPRSHEQTFTVTVREQPVADVTSVPAR